LENAAMPSHGRLSACAPPGESHAGTAPVDFGSTEAADPGHGQKSTNVTLSPSGTAEWHPMH
jgi:hypothetical protein